MFELRWVGPRADESAWRAVLAGAIAGAAGALAMAGTQRLIMRRRSAAAADHQQEDEDQQGNRAGARGRSNGEERQGDPPTTNAANALSKSFRGREPSPEAKKRADPIMHYAMGTFTGAVYGMFSELAPFVAVARGLPYGTGVWILADELTVPALGLAPPSTKSPARSHLEALVAHLVYGLSLDLVRRAIRRALR